jgi:tetratricopeptide (TPR) repeat protein
MARPYNRVVLNRLLTLFAVVVALVCVAGASPAQVGARQSKTIVVLPFENASKVPGLEWIGDSFPEVLDQRMVSPARFMVGREDRLYAFDRSGIPENLRPSRATMYRIAEDMDVDYVVLGDYTYDGQTFTARAQMFNVKRLHLSPEQQESGPLPNLIEIQTALAWDLMHSLESPEQSQELLGSDSRVSKAEFLAKYQPIRLDAFENYVRGISATTRPEKLKFLREAVRLNPSYTAAEMELGRTYFDAHEYEQAAGWFSRVPKTDEKAGEASFYAGLSYYYNGDLDRARVAFSFLATRFPLTEVYNNLGVVDARRLKRTAVDYFQKTVDADPNDPDYRFNLGVSLYQNGDLMGAQKQLLQAVVLHPSDAEAKMLLDAINSGQRPARVPTERIKRNYNESSYLQLALEIQNAAEIKLAASPPAKHAEYHVEHGHEVLDKGFNTEAAGEFREAIQLDPANARAHAGLARALAGMGDTKQARSEAETALKLKPQAEAYLVLADLELRDNHLDEAASDTDKALRLEPANAAGLAMKRSIEMKRAQPAAATAGPAAQP